MVLENKGVQKQVASICLTGGRRVESYQIRLYMRMPLWTMFCIQIKDSKIDY